MRKIFVLLLVTLLSLTMVACKDKQIDDSRFNVIFYVGANASYVDTYFDVKENTKIDEPEEPSRTGYFFSGWFKNIERTEAWSFDQDVVTESLVLYAKWSPANWQISFVLNEELGEIYVNPDNIPTEFDLNTNVYLPLVKRPGGSFRGWILVPTTEYTLDMTIYRYTSELPITSYTEFILYPVFTNNKYMITFSPKMDGVPVPAPKTGVEYGSVITWVPAIEDTATHTFVGWFTKNGANTGDWGYQVENGDLWSVAANALLYGRWEPK